MTQVEKLLREIERKRLEAIGIREDPYDLIVLTDEPGNIVSFVRKHDFSTVKTMYIYDARKAWSHLKGEK